MKRTVLPALLVMLLTACALGPAAKPEDDAKARLLQPVSDKAVIYLIRDRGAGTILFIGRVTDPTAV